MSDQFAPGSQVALSPTLSVNRVIHGLWQVADMERHGNSLDPDTAANAMASYADQGFLTFDMADHYGSAEIIAGHFKRRYSQSDTVRLLTKWCPAPAFLAPEDIRKGVDQSFQRMGLDHIDLMQFHWWHYPHPAYLDCLQEMTKLQEEGKIGALGLTNFDTDHLRVVLADGIPVVSNQICYSLLDRRAGEKMARLCLEYDIHLLCYGTLAGGFLTDRWLGVDEPGDLTDWSKMKYKRFIDQIGGWQKFQNLLRTVRQVADRHDCSIAAIASAWVLHQPAVASVIIGARLGERNHSAETKRLLDIRLTKQDLNQIDDALDELSNLPGDCGDDYRKPPYLTASGDLSHHISSFPKIYNPVTDRKGRLQIDSGSEWEPICGYCRALRIGNRILVSGTTATHGNDRVVAPGNAAAQTTYVLDKIVAAVEALGGAADDIIRTRVFLQDEADVDAISYAHGTVFGDIRPANTLFQAGNIIGDYLVEIEAEAEILP